MSKSLRCDPGLHKASRTYRVKTFIWICHKAWSIICTTLDICSNILSQHFQSRVAQIDQNSEYISGPWLRMMTPDFQFSVLAYSLSYGGHLPKLNRAKTRAERWWWCCYNKQRKCVLIKANTVCYRDTRAPPHSSHVIVNPHKYLWQTEGNLSMHIYSAYFTRPQFLKKMLYFY